MKWPNPYSHFCTLHFLIRQIDIFFFKTGFLIRIYYYVRLFFYISFFFFLSFHSTFQLVHHQKHFVCFQYQFVFMISFSRVFFGSLFFLSFSFSFQSLFTVEHSLMYPVYIYCNCYDAVILFIQCLKEGTMAITRPDRLMNMMVFRYKRYPPSFGHSIEHCNFTISFNDF